MNCRLCAFMLPAVAILAAASIVGAHSYQDEGSGDTGTQVGTVNSTCPFSGKPVGSDSPTVSQDGNTIGFCCNGCLRRWRAMDEPQRQTILASFIPAVPAETPLPADALSLARAYLEGMEAGRLDALDELFLPDGGSSILENASDEGSWEHYRDHHLKPEMESTNDFSFTVTDEKEQRFGSTSLVRQVGTFTIQVGDEQRAYRAAVSYLVVEDAGSLKIAHLHWSSRPKRK